MAEWTARRFWARAHVRAEEGGFAVRLDDKPIRTPSGAGLVVPTRALADLVAAEWEAQAEIVDPRTMPNTRSANSAIEKVAPRRREIEAMLAEYGGTDLLCYRAADPGELVARQAAEWDPLLDWAADRYGARLATTTGILPITQSGDALRRLSRPLAGMGAFELTGFHDLVTLSGSLVLALAAVAQVAPASELWQVSRLDEIWQSEQWGRDDDAERAAAAKGRDFLHAARFMAVSRTSG